MNERLCGRLPPSVAMTLKQAGLLPAPSLLVGGNPDKAYGRSVGVVILPDAALLVMDDAGNKIRGVRAAPVPKPLS